MYECSQYTRDFHILDKIASAEYINDPDTKHCTRSDEVQYLKVRLMRSGISQPTRSLMVLAVHKIVVISGRPIVLIHL